MQFYFAIINKTLIFFSYNNIQRVRKAVYTRRFIIYITMYFMQ